MKTAGLPLTHAQLDLKPAPSPRSPATASWSSRNFFQLIFLYDLPRGGRLQKAVSSLLETGVKRGFLNPDYMQPAWKAELDQARRFFAFGPLLSISFFDLHTALL